MSNLLASLSSAAGSISVFEKALAVTQNNIANSATPGYVEQTPSFEPITFDPNSGAAGGVTSGPVIDARNVFAEKTVQRAQTALGTWEEQVSTLQGLQTSFDITGASGIPGALNTLFSAFSTWSAAPNDSTAQQSVLNGAQGLALAFHQQAAAISSAATGADSELSSLVSQVNTLAGKIRQDNIQNTNGSAADPAVQADLYNNLEQLSEIAPITTLKESDGSLSVFLAGQTPLVIGQTQYQISSDVAVPTNPPPTNPGGPPSAQVLDANGSDITALITTGKIGGVLQARNGTLAQLQGDSNQQGSLNQLAQAIADRVNSLLTGGNISDANPVTGAPAVPGVPLFTYDATNPAAAASTFAVNPGITPGQLAAIDPGPPEVGNGIPLKLANLAAPQNAADKINNVSYTEFYGGIAGQLGTAISTAQDSQTTSQDALSQAQALRQQDSGVDLNAEAIKVLQFQQSYDAASKMVTILAQLTQNFLDAIQLVQ
jgi:flagellar hook-associated protein 1 FlgK